MAVANDDLTVCIKRTQEILGKYVRKPSLSEKLLKKPPFRFLHDVIHVIIRDTGYFMGLYTEEELKSDNIKDREGKMNFLQKIIDVVKLTTNVPLTVRTSKIVAGLEPNKTNELLQLIGDIIDKQLNWKLAVETVLGSDHGQNKGQRQDQGQTHSKQPEDDTKRHSHVNKTNNDENKQSKQKTKISEENAKYNASKNRDRDKSNKKHGINNEKSSNKESNSKRVKDKEKVQYKQQMVSKEKDTVNKDTNKSKEKLQQTKATVKTAEVNAKLQKSALQTSEAIDDKQQQQQKQQEKTYINQVKEHKKSTENIASESSPNETIVGSQSSMEKNANTPISFEMPVSNAANKLLSLANEEASTSSNKKQMENMPQQNENWRAINDENKFSTSINNDDTNDEQEQQQNEKEKESRNLEIEALQNVELNKTTTTTKSNDIKEASTIQTMVTTIASTNATTTTTTMPANIRRQSTFTRRETNDLESEVNEYVRPKTSSLRPPSVRPPSARPGAPRRRDKNIEIILQPNEQIQMAGVNIKLDPYINLQDVDDDGENLVIIESTNSINDENNVNTQQATINNTEDGNEVDGQEEEGFLIQQILETQREFMQDNPESTQQKQQRNNLSQSLITRQTSAHSVNNLRENLVELSKSINSLSKLMEFIPEDIDAMQLEINMWRDAFSQATIELQKERSLTESSTEPLKNQLTHIETNIAEYTEMIDSSRARILQNTEKIFNLYNIQ